MQFVHPLNVFARISFRRVARLRLLKQLLGVFKLVTLELLSQLILLLRLAHSVEMNTYIVTLLELRIVHFAKFVNAYIS